MVFLRPAPPFDFEQQSPELLDVDVLILIFEWRRELGTPSPPTRGGRLSLDAIWLHNCARVQSHVAATAVGVRHDVPYKSLFEAQSSLVPGSFVAC